MLKKAPRSSSRSRSRGRGARSNRANTQPAPLPDYLKDPNYKSPYAQNNSGLATISDEQQGGNNNNNDNNNNLGGGNNGQKQSGHQLKKSTDDLLDLFGMSASANSNNSNSNGNGNSNNNLNTDVNDFMNPFASSVPNQLPSQQQQQPRAHAYSAVNTNQNNMFGDDFFGGFGSNNNNNNSNNNNSNNNNGNANNNNNNDNLNTKDSIESKSKSKKSKKPKNAPHSKSAQSSGSTEDDDDDDEKGSSYRRSPRPEKPPPKPKAKTRKNRAQTDAAALGKPTKNAPDPPKKVKTKSIDVLPLLHTGIKANKFKFGQNKSKVRTFYLTKDNQWFCWEPVGGPLQAKPNRKKIDPTRSIFIRSIREVKKNSPAMVQDLNFIPAQHKGLTISIVYDLKGSEKKVNLMAYEPFHHVLVFEAIHKLSVMGQNINRDLGNVFELYVDFEKEILPKHLRPQRFKWEPLGKQDIDSAEKDKEDGGKVENAFETIDSFDPTQERRNRLKSF